MRSIPMPIVIVVTLVLVGIAPVAAVSEPTAEVSPQAPDVCPALSVVTGLLESGATGVVDIEPVAALNACGGGACLSNRACDSYCLLHCNVSSGTCNGWGECECAGQQQD